MTHHTITLPRAEYNDFCDQLHRDGHISADQADKFKELGHIPLIYRGGDTEFIFTQFHITGSLATIMIEGSIATQINYLPLEELN